jgi:hypothetical protein
VSASATGNGAFRWDRTRSLALLAIVALHAAFIVLLWHSKLAVRREEPAPAMQVVMLLPRLSERPPPAEPRRKPSSIEPVTPVTPSAPSESEAQAGSNAPTAVPWVDWEREGKDAARREAEAHPLPALPPRKKQPFGWSHSHIKRIEKVEGAYLLWLSDRCALVNFIIPACKVGKKPARGDLFDRMEEALANEPEVP